MTWKYKLIEFGVEDRLALSQSVRDMMHNALQKAHSQLNWEEIQKEMTNEERKEYATKHIFPLGDKFLSEILQKKMKGDLSHLDLTTRLRNQKLTHVQYLELTINKFAIHGWELDRIRNFKDKPDNGYLVLKKKAL